jgi:hypothetical protein
MMLYRKKWIASSQLNNPVPGECLITTAREFLRSRLCQILNFNTMLFKLEFLGKTRFFFGNLPSSGIRGIRMGGVK